MATSSEGQLRRRSRYKSGEHRVVYERHHGPIPPGYDVHHKDDDKLNNDPSNLEALSRSDHKRLHFGWKSDNGVWLKPCSRCGEHKPLTEFYEKKGSVNGTAYCKPCNTVHMREYRIKGTFDYNGYMRKYRRKCRAKTKAQ